MSQELHNLLASQAMDGVLDSEGSFTIDLERSRRKSHKFGAENQDKAILKLISVVLARNPLRLDLVLKKESLTIQASGADPLLQDARTLGGDFGSALWSCHYSGFPEIYCRLRGQCLRLSDDGVHDLADRWGGAHQSVVVELVFQKIGGGFWESFRSLLKTRGISTITLQRSLRFARTPIYLDQRTLNSPTENGEGKLALELYLTGADGTENAEISYLSQNARRARFTVNKDHKFGEENSWTTFCKVQIPAEKQPFGVTRPSWLTVKNLSVLAHLWVPVSTKGQSMIVLIQNGIIVGTRPFPVPGVVSANGLDTDITGLAVVENTKLERLESYLQASVARACRQALKLSPPSPYSPAISRAMSDLT